MDEAFEKSLFKLKDGEISTCREISYGYHIIRADKGEASKNKRKPKRTIPSNENSKRTKTYH